MRKCKSTKESPEVIKGKAYKYYCMGLNSKEIAVLLGVSFRTIQNYMLRDAWKKQREPGNLKFEALKLYELGLTYDQIAQKIRVSRATVYLYLKQTRQFKEKQETRKGKNSK